MSEIEEYLFERPRPAEEVPEALEYLLTRIKAKLPVPLETISRDVLEMSFMREIDDSTVITIRAFLDEQEDEYDAPEHVTLYLEIEEDYDFSDSAEALAYTRFRRIAIEEGSLISYMNEVFEIEYEDKDEGYVTERHVNPDESGDEKMDVDTHQLAEIAKVLERLPDIQSLETAEIVYEAGLFDVDYVVSSSGVIERLIHKLSSEDDEDRNNI